jgi:hypothetical protein
MNPYTSLAIEAFRKQEQARRRLNRAEGEVFKAVRLMPEEDRNLWFLYTELIRLEESWKDSAAAGDHDGAGIAREHIAVVKRQIRQAEQAAETSQPVTNEALAAEIDSEVNEYLAGQPVRATWKDHGNPQAFTYDKWETWPPERELHTGREYLIRTKDGQQKYVREHRMSYLGRGLNTLELQFNARPFAGTQLIHVNSIIAVKDLGPSGGRTDSERYMNRIIR